MTIQAIETQYNGYRFRSRLEARWAVFFDSLGIQYEYEKEGYNLGDAGFYLPDFYLQTRPPLVGNHWCEIKPEPLSQTEIDKLTALVYHTKIDAFALCGRCDRNGFDLCEFYYFGEPGSPPGYEGPWPKVFASISPGEGEFVDQIAILTGMLNVFQPRLSSSDEARLINTAFLRAKSARFEHGEKPVPRLAMKPMSKETYPACPSCGQRFHKNRFGVFPLSPPSITPNHLAAGNPKDPIQLCPGSRQPTVTLSGRGDGLIL